MAERRPPFGGWDAESKTDEQANRDDVHEGGSSRNRLFFVDKTDTRSVINQIVFMHAKTRDREFESSIKRARRPRGATTTSSERRKKGSHTCKFVFRSGRSVARIWLARSLLSYFYLRHRVHNPGRQILTPVAFLTASIDANARPNQPIQVRFGLVPLVLVRLSDGALPCRTATPINRSDRARPLNSVIRRPNPPHHNPALPHSRQHRQQQQAVAVVFHIDRPKPCRATITTTTTTITPTPPPSPSRYRLYIVC